MTPFSEEEEMVQVRRVIVEDWEQLRNIRLWAAPRIPDTAVGVLITPLARG